ncbi:molybdate ABC transporter substrate-binding protein [Amaricoccus sp.]|uniref:molybdate ABC transporter substrate-binding protein n=1 Tax=Amaricoccus sp. TaxID=1872485 RepID=UPI001B64E88A|nr:molybdate ABC transporter substrate-binding protein [Amaricoccus sp.]MBP7242709.1 molybdate ABC transporter substrate-binding protein [Amaricoccus sp.]
MFHGNVRGIRRTALGLALAALVAAPAAAADVTVFAAASLKNALDAVAEAWAGETGNAATISYAASSALAKQIEEGAPADVFISADVPWMDYLAERDLVQKDTIVELLGNRLVLVAPAESTAAIELAPGADLVGLLGDGRLAMGQVDSVPAGKYGKEALTALGVWDGVADRLAQAENVRAALALVATGEAPFGIVYETDANAEPAVRVVATFPEDSHSPIVYPAAVTTAATSPEAAAFLDYLKGSGAAELFEAQGFTVLAR